MSKLIYCIFSILILILIKSSAFAQEGFHEYPEGQTKIDEFVMYGIDLGPKLQKQHRITLEEIYDSLGKPYKIDKKEFVNSFNINIINYTFYYPELTLEYIWLPRSKDGFFIKIRSCSLNYKYKYEIKIGDSQEQVINKIGIPFKRDDNYLVYEAYPINNPLQHYAHFYFDNGILKCIEWEYNTP